MQHDAFIGQVQARARLSSRGAAEEATRATLETLAERLNPDLADDLAAQLPREIGEHVHRVVSQGGEHRAERFDEEEFIARVGQRAHADRPKAVHTTRAVFEVLDEATTGSLMEKVRQGLPEDLRRLTLAGGSD